MVIAVIRQLSAVTAELPNRQIPLKGPDIWAIKGLPQNNSSTPYNIVFIGVGAKQENNRCMTIPNYQQIVQLALHNESHRNIRISGKLFKAKL